VALAAFAAYGLAWSLTSNYRVAVDGLRFRAVLTLAPLLLFAAAFAYFAATEELVLGGWMLAGLALLCAALFNSKLNWTRTRDSLEFTLLRKNLLAARRYFARELRTPHPRLRDAWLPYLLAFDLGPGVDRWFRSYGGKSGDVTAGASTSSTVSTGAWSGGGGTFAGAGATGAWIAAGGIAAGVAAPDSGGSGSGGRRAAVRAGWRRRMGDPPLGVGG
jgi:uncharacterized membrane protein YgcG